MGTRVIVSPDLPEAARGLLEADPRATLYHHPRWIEALSAAYPRFSASYLVLEEDGEATGMIPLAEATQYRLREVVSMPFGTHGGPVLAPGATAEGVRALTLAFMEQLRGVRTFRFEMTVLDPPAFVRETLNSHLGKHFISSSTLFLDLTPGAEAIWEGYDQRLRRNVRRAAGAGVTVREETAVTGMASFFELYRAQAKTRPIAWHHSSTALGAIVGALGNDVRIWIAGHEGTDLCAQLVLHHAHREIHFWLSGASPESRSVSAFHYLLHNIIQDASRKGYATCDFGSSMGDRGVERFKRSFGAVDRPLLRFCRQPRWVEWIQRIRS